MNSITHLIKYLLVALIYTALLPSQGFSQEMGLKTGLNWTGLSNFSGPKVGIQAGAFAQFGSDPHLFFQAELLFSQRGAYNWSRKNLRHIRLQYMELPLMFGIMVRSNLFLNLGIQPALRIGGSFKFTEDENFVKLSMGNQMKRFDYSTLIGLEYRMDNNWTLGARFVYSFVPIAGYNVGILSNDGLLINRMFTIYAAFPLTVGRAKELVERFR